MSETLEPALPAHLDQQADQLMRKLCNNELTVATAESCTGGMLAALLTDIEGAGHGFDRGFVTYTNEAKAELLGIDRDGADLAVGVTGFAGPAGPGNEEGLVHMALASRNAPTLHREEHFGAIGRGSIRVRSLEVMLEMLSGSLDECAASPGA